MLGGGGGECSSAHFRGVLENGSVSADLAWP